MLCNCVKEPKETGGIRCEHSDGEWFIFSQLKFKVKAGNELQSGANIAGMFLLSTSDMLN